MRHWSTGTPWENVKAAAPAVYEGMPWDMSPEHPVPAGFVVAAGRLVALGSQSAPASAGAGASWDEADRVAASADRMLREARSAGWRPGGNYAPGGLYDAGNRLTCGVCTPCRNGSRSQCIQPNSAVAKAEAARRAQMRAEHEDAELLAGRGWAPANASGYSFVETVGERIEHGRRLAELRDRYGL